MLKTLRGQTTKPVEDDGPQPANLGGKTKKRKARLVKPKTLKGKPKANDVIVVAIPKTFVRSEVIQTSKKLNFPSVTGGNFNIPVGGAKSSVVIYTIEVRNSAGDTWKLEKTFKDFANLRNRINEKFPCIFLFAVL
eukprot:maker-scaffold_6-snap-gene-8.1-mRNA-1 protein AED:0.14 eAED:0.14 QI:376/1/0.8/1/0.5/0.4/5/0/135